MLINFPSLKSGEGGFFASGLANRGSTVGLICKTTTFMYISLPSVHDYDVKVPNSTFCGEGNNTRKQLFFFFS